MGERHSPSPSVRIRFSVFVEDSKESAAAAAAKTFYIFFDSVPSFITHSNFSRRSCVGERHSPSPSCTVSDLRFR